MTDSSKYQTNRDLFSNHYLKNTLRDREPWNEVPDEEVREAHQEITDLMESKSGRVEDYNEAQLERNLIRPILDILGIPFEIEETVMRNARRPDYGFFPSADAADAAFDREDFYEESIAVADAKRWGRKLDTRGEEKRDFENPSYQIHRYLQETPTQWAVLTNGEKWRLYYEPTSHRLDSYYEIDLPAILDAVTEEENIEQFKYFYLFFRQEAFRPDETGDCFLDDVYDQSNVFAEELGEDLQENIYEAIRVLAEGFIDSNEELDEEDLDLIHDSSLIYLYRLIFILYAESEDRNLLPTNNDIYSSSYSLNELKQTVVDNRGKTQQQYQSWQTDLWERLNELFMLIDQGSQGQNIPKEDLYIPAYNGGLFRTNPDSEDSDEAQFLASHEVGDVYIGEVIELLTRHEASEGDGKVFVDYSSLDERNLGSIYEGLLEYKLDVADAPLTVEDGEYVTAEESENIAVQSGEVYLRTDDGERKATGSYYTPEYVVEYIVDETLAPVVDDIQEDMLAESARGEEREFADEFADRIFDLTVLDPAMGSGHFLVNAVDYLAREIIDAQEQQDRQAIDSEKEVRSPTTEEGEIRDINWARRQVAQKCIYGVDINGLATELAKVSLWLRTLAAEQPLAFLDHHLKTGNSLVGSDITDVLSEDNGDGAGQLTLTQSFARARQETLGHVMNLMEDLLAIDNDELADIKSMEDLYDEIRADPLYGRLFEIANVHTAEQFGVDVPEGVYEEMAGAVDDGDAWEEIRSQDWFRSAQATADEQSFFHWEIEFPEVFFSEDGEKREDAGFDAVIGNPPWGHPGEQKDYLKNKYSEIVKRLPDAFSYFVYHSIMLTNNKGKFGMIVPNVSLFQSEYAKLRSKIVEVGLTQVIDLGENVFHQVVAPSTILICDLDNKNDTIEITNLRENKYSIGNHQSETFKYSIDNIKFDNNYTIPVYNIRLNNILIDIKMNSKIMGDVLEIEQGVQTGGDDRFTVTTSEIEEFDLEKEFIKPTLFGSDLVPYYIYDKDQYVLYIPRNADSSQIPNIKNYLTQYKEKLSSVSEVEKGIRPWYSLHRPRDPDTFEQNKILLRQTSDTLKAAYDPDKHYNIHSLLCISEKSNKLDILDLKSLACMLNSTLLRGFYSTITQEQDRVFAEVKAQNVKKLPLPAAGSENMLEENQINEIENIIEDIDKSDLKDKSIVSFLSELYPVRSEIEEKRINLNLNLLDHLGNYTDGQTLADIGLTQPPRGAADSILQATTQQYPNLRVGDVSVVRESASTVEIRLTARYKPEVLDDEVSGPVDNREADQWGYVETDPEAAFRVTDLSEREVDLIEAFVPVAVEEAGGFADFRETATKTNSLVDRLRKLTLPNLANVENGLENYVQTKERAEELEEKTQEVDELIDEIVYDLYGLTDEEIEIVEEAVGDN